MQAWSSPDLGLGLETSGDPVLEVLVMVLVSNTEVRVLVWVLKPRVSVSVLVWKTYSLGLVLETLY